MSAEGPEKMSPKQAGGEGIESRLSPEMVEVQRQHRLQVFLMTVYCARLAEKAEMDSFAEFFDKVHKEKPDKRGRYAKPAMKLWTGPDETKGMAEKFRVFVEKPGNWERIEAAVKSNEFLNAQQTYEEFRDADNQLSLVKALPNRDKLYTLLDEIAPELSPDKK